MLTTVAESKRSKVDSESNPSNNAESGPRSFARRISTAQTDPASGYQSDYNSPTTRVAPATYYPAKSTSPASRPSTILNSPRTTDAAYSPPMPSHSTLQREMSYDYQPSSLGRDRMSITDSDMAVPSSGYGLAHPIPSISPSSNMGPSQYQTTDLPSRRSYREPTRLPLLTHEDTTLSSESSGTQRHSIFGGGQQLPPMDPERSMRILPQPIPSKGISISLLDHSLTKNASPPPHPNYAPSSLEALVRAGELARVADDQEADLQQQQTP